MLLTVQRTWWQEKQLLQYWNTSSGLDNTQQEAFYACSNTSSAQNTKRGQNGLTGCQIQEVSSVGGSRHYQGHWEATRMRNTSHVVIVQTKVSFLVFWNGVWSRMRISKWNELIIVILTALSFVDAQQQQLPTGCECPLDCVCSLSAGTIDCSQADLQFVPVEINSCEWPGFSTMSVTHCV